MKTQNPFVLFAGAVLLAVAVCAQADTNWTEGKHYFLIQPVQPTSAAPGKVEVTEVFSYGCPACNQFYPYAEKLKAGLPKNAQFNLVPASFNPSEDWPMFQRAFYAAQALNLVERTHKAMFDAIWQTYELAIVEPRTNRLKNPLPSIEDAAKFYNRVTGVKPEEFVSVAKSFSVELNMKRADAWSKACKVESTPTIVVAGKYRMTVTSAGGTDELNRLINYLVAKETR